MNKTETIQQKAVRLAYLADGEDPDNHEIDSVVNFLDGDIKFAIDCKVIELAIAEEREANKYFPLEPTDEMREAGAKRLVCVESDADWPDKFTALQRSAARNEAERIWRSMWLAAPKVEVAG